MKEGSGYEFCTLVVCLLILALQIHNPFQPRSATCDCGSGSGNATPVGPYVPPQQSHPGLAADEVHRQARRLEDEPPAMYRRPQAPREVVGSGSPTLSSDDLLRELDAIQVKAKEHQDTLAAAGRMPPASPILQHIRDTEAAAGISNRATPPRPSARPPAVPPGVAAAAAVPPAMPPRSPQARPATATGMAVGGAAQAFNALRRREDFGHFLQSQQPRGLGVVLGVGRGDFALRLLSDWTSSSGVLLVDPFIHIWRGYDDPANLPDRDHQMVFEDLRNRLAPFEGRHALIRDFSYSFAETYLQPQPGSPSPGPPTFVYVDANPSEPAVSRDIDQWWSLLAPGGMLAGGTYEDDVHGPVRVRTCVDRFAAKHNLQVYATQDDRPASWFIFKP